MPHRRPIPDRSGVTIIELLVTVAIMAGLLLIITQIFILNYNVFQKQTQRTDNEVGAVLAAKTISELARGADDIEASHIFGSDTWTSSAAALVLKLPAIDVSNSLIADAYDYVAFYRQPTATTNIMVTTDAAAGSVRRSGTRLVTAYNSTLIFRYNNPTLTSADRISAYLTNSQTYRGLTLTTRGWTSIFLRNK